MKKVKKAIFVLAVLNLFVSCRQLNSKLDERKTFDETENSIIKKCYSKDFSSDFLAFLNGNPEESVSVHRSAVPADNENKLTKEEIFARIWESLTDEEKEQLLANSSETTMSFENSIGIDKDTEIGRAILDGDSFELEQTAKRYSLIYKLEDNFDNQYISAKFAPETLEISQDEIVPVVQIIEYYIQNELWENVEEILREVDSQITVKELKQDYNSMIDYDFSNTVSRSSMIVDYKENALVNNLGKQLPDGAVLLMCSHQNAFVIAGDWVHAGIFSKKKYNDKEGDASLCVYTAQPDIYQKFPENMQPDRPGHACLDRVFMYTRQKRIAAILPKNYSTTKAEYAVDNAKRIFYDTNANYSLPVNEFFYIGDTSHDETNKNTYCSKVVYTGWKKAGVNLDSKTFAGNLVSPDDLYGSSFDRYASVTVRVLWWSKTWTWKSYSATSDIILKKEQ